jgi:uncharacterized protein YecE (DUF72 family)
LKRVRIGASGWVYSHWRGIFYDERIPQREWFAHYAQHFDTVEINNSFYRLPSAGAFSAWREQAPEGFLYSVKASRYLTHMKKLKEPEDALRLFFERAAELRHCLGPVLYQLPPRWRLNAERFERFLQALPAGYTHVVEFREPSWLVDEVFRMMDRFGVAHCLHDHPLLEAPCRITGPAVYVRFHGGVSHAGDYSAETLKVWARRIRSWRRDRQVYAYFNNDVGGYALQNAATLKAMLSL